MTKGERVKVLRNSLGGDGKKMTLEEFGERLGVAKTTVSRIENGVNALTDQMCKSICREFGVSEEWLMHGTGDMMARTVDDAASEFAQKNGLDHVEEVLIREYLHLTDTEKGIFRKYLNGVMKELASTSVADQEPDNESESKKNPFDKMTIDEKVASYRAELEAEEAARMSGASPTGEGDEAVKDA